jgi:hypothetical protein
VKRTTLAVALATGALAVPAVAFAAGGDDPAAGTQQQAPQTAPVQQQQEQPQQPDQQRPDRGDCPEHDGSGGSGESSGGSGSGDTLL